MPALQAPLPTFAVNSPPCADHPDSSATTACSRCGGFLCDGCSTGSGPFSCRPCFERRRDERRLLGAQPYSFAGTLAHAARLYVGGGASMVILLTLVGIAEGLVQVQWIGRDFLKLPVWWTVPLALVELGVNGAVLLLARARAQGEPLAAPAALRQSFGRWTAMFGALFEANLVTGFFLLLGIIPGLLKIGEYAVVIPVTLLEQAKPTERSTALTKGRRLAILGMVTFVGIPRILLVLGASLIARRAMAPVASLLGAVMLVHVLFRIVVRFSQAFTPVLALSIYVSLLASERATQRAAAPVEEA
jgi:hypothetical protein